MIEAGVIQPELGLMINIDSEVKAQGKESGPEEKETTYVLGEYMKTELPYWGGCGTNLRELFVLDKELSGNKSRLMREVSCGHCGNPSTSKITVKNSQLIKEEIGRKVIK